MVDRFVALPVGQGDAFFYQRDDLKILVDGGKGKKNFPKLFDNHLNIKEIDIMICTHNDADHTNGLIGILEEQKVIINEVWLPGSWSYKLKELLENPDSFFSELAEDISKIPDRELSTLENLTIFRKDSLQEVDRYEEIDNESLFRSCNQNTKLAYKLYSNLLRILEPSSWLSQPKRRNLWLSAINAASRIRKIATLAYSQGLKVRWFDFNEFKRKDQPSGGKKGDLEPVNACEILPRVANTGTLQYLYLTVENRQSLVFVGLENKNRPGVTFTGDSDLDFNFQHQPPTVSMIITTPHHGSDNNKNAYQVINSWHKNPSSLIWVRSDQKSKTRPGGSFLSVKRQQQVCVCTICRPFNHDKQHIEMLHQQSGSIKWILQSGLRTCQC